MAGGYPVDSRGICFDFAEVVIVRLQIVDELLFAVMVGRLIAQDHEIGLAFCNKVSGVCLRISAPWSLHSDVASGTRIASERVPQWVRRLCSVSRSARSPLCAPQVQPVRHYVVEHAKNDAAVGHSPYPQCTASGVNSDTH